MPASVPSRVWESKDFLYLVPILLLAAALRLVNLDYMEFKGDEADNLFNALSIVTGGRFQLVGIESSIGTLSPPLFSYLMAIPLFFSRNPVVAAGFVAVGNCVAVVALYFFCLRFFNARVARIAALFFAVNPWAVFYSRKIWQQDLLPLFVVGFFFCLGFLANEKRGLALTGAFVCLAAATQLHLSAIYLVVVFVGVWVCQRPKIPWPYYVAGVGLLFFSYAPYFVFDINHGGINAKAYLEVLSRPSHFHREALFLPFQLASAKGFLSQSRLPMLDFLQMAMVGGGAIYAVARIREPSYLILTLWFLIPMMCLSFSKLDLFQHYFIVFYPVQFILAAILVDALVRGLATKSKTLSMVCGFLVAGMAAYPLSVSASFVEFIKSQKNIAWMEYGPPFKVRVDEIRNLSKRGVVSPEQMQRLLMERRPAEAALKYDFSATKYIFRNLDAMP